MKTSDYADSMVCEKISLFKGMEKENEGRTALVLYHFFQNLSSATAKAAGSRGVGADALRTVNDLAQKDFERALSQFQPEWFGGEHSMERKKELMKAFYRRFMGWYIPFIADATIVATDYTVSLPVINCNGDRVVLEDRVMMILEKGGVTYAVVVKTGKNSAGLCKKARTDGKKIENDFRLSVIKSCLEAAYPGILLLQVFFQEGERKGVIEPWKVDNTAKTNVAELDFADCYNDGRFDDAYCLSKAEKVLTEKAEQPSIKKCEGCIHQSECQIQTISQTKPAEKNTAGKWKMPEFDEWQQTYVEHMEGPVLVLAGPGSGKTASSVGRVIRLAEKGVPSEKILIVTFTEKAAGEVMTRLRGAFSEDEMPKISTLHGIAIEIVNLYERMHKLPYSRPYTTPTEKALMKKVLDDLPMLTGVSYRTYCDGKYSTVASVTNGMKQYRKDMDVFFEKHPDYVPEEWERLEDVLLAKKKEENLLTFDEILDQAADILQTEDDIKAYYYGKFHYMIVDEYQDTNALQDRLITQLNGHGNLACVGDDDQSIYRFNGASPEYVLNFQRRYPDAEKLLLPVNYRTTNQLVEFNNHILKLMGNGRIDKHIRGASCAEEGVKPLYIPCNEPWVIDRQIEEARKMGYEYSDIAVIGTTNKPLSQLNEQLASPTELASAYLTSDFLFRMNYALLALVLEKGDRMTSLIRIGYLLEKEGEWYKRLRTENILSDDVRDLLEFAKKQSEETPEHFVARTAAYLDLDGSTSEEAMVSLARTQQELPELYQTMSDMLTYGDEKKVEYPIRDSVTLITAHSCKGKEWPVVIVYDTDAYGDTIGEDSEDSMDLRLFYVTATRAKQMVVFLKKEDSECLLDTSVLSERVCVS
jgi:superfamily I DNA/RNA helicase